jgi:glycosyltransferase involved in cell wall biosynthesis
VRVGAIVPVRGPAPWLAEALASAAGQERPPDRIVVVDDGSAERVVVGGDLTVVRRDARGGPAAARETGWRELAGCELIALLDADDAWEPGALAAHLESLERHPDAALSFGSALMATKEGRPTGERWPAPPPGPQDPAELARFLFRVNPIASSAVVLRAGALEAAGGFASDHQVAEDYDLWLRMLGRGLVFVHTPTAGARVRRRRDSLSADIARLAEEKLRVQERHTALVEPAVARAARADLLRARAQGLIRRRDYAGARAALAEAAALEPLPARLRVASAATRVPGLRAALGRRSPYAGVLF